MHMQAGSAESQAGNPAGSVTVKRYVLGFSNLPITFSLGDSGSGLTPFTALGDLRTIDTEHKCVPLTKNANAYY